MPEQDPSRFEALKQGAKEKLAIGLVALAGLGSLATAEQANAEPVNTANVPEANASDQLQDCVDAALARPLVMRSTMFSPGDNKHARQQEVDGYVRFKPTSVACAPLVSRETPVAQMKMQRPNNHSKLIKSKKKELTNHPDGETVPMDANAGRLGSVAFGRDYGDGNKQLYRCTPGKGVTKAWLTYKVKAVSPLDNHVLGKRTFTQPIRIRRTRPDLIPDGLPGPC